MVPVGYPNKNSNNRKVKSARGMMGRGKRRELFLFPLCHRSPRAFFFPLSSPPYDTKMPLRRRELERTKSQPFVKQICFHSIISNWRLRFLLPSIIIEDLLGNRTLLKWAQKVMVCESQIERIESVFRSGLCVSVFQGSLLVIVIMIEGSEKRNCEGGFSTLEFACLWKAQ